MLFKSNVMDRVKIALRVTVTGGVLTVLLTKILYKYVPLYILYIDLQYKCGLYR